jgi:hypothetical protein
MIAKAIPNTWTNTLYDYYEVEDWTVVVYHNVYSFKLKYVGSSSECKQHADMFNKALENHDMETLNKFLSGDPSNYKEIK